MSRLIWTPAALHDLHRLYRFLAQANQKTAARAIKSIREGIGTLRQHPEIGRPAEDFGLDYRYREWPVNFGSGGYLVLYHYDGKTVLIVAVRHQKEVGYESQKFDID